MMGTHGLTVAVVPNLLRSDLQRLRKQTLFCTEDLSFETITRPQRHRDTFV